MLRLCLVVWLCIWSVSAFENWPYLSEEQNDAVRTQRDTADDIPLDQLSFSGVSLNQLVFDPLGYNLDALNQVLSLLNVKTGALMVDLYWNEFTQTWQLCPAPFPNNLTQNLTDTVGVTWKGRTYQCQPGFTPTDLVSTVSLYFRSSNVKINANIVLVLLNLKSIYYEPERTATNKTYNYTSTVADTVPSGYESPGASYLLVGNSTLAQSVSGLEGWLFSPLDLVTFSQAPPTGNYTNYYSSEYPTQTDFLFSLFKRTMVTVVNNNLHTSNKGYNISTTDSDTIFIPDYAQFQPTFVNASNTTILNSCSERRHSSFDASLFSVVVGQSRFRTVVDSETSPFTNQTLHQWAGCGFNTILNASYSAYASQFGAPANDTANQLGAIVNNFTPIQYWSWAPNEPNTSLENSTSALSESDESDAEDNPNEITSTTQVAYKCIAMVPGGWSLKNCYDKYRVACQNESDPFDWILLTSLATYFDLTSDSRCPDHYVFNVPQLSIEQAALATFLDSKNILAPVWIDLNDITVNGCFVTGGPYAECPYTKIVSTLNLIRQIAPSIVVAFVILLLIFYEKFVLMVPVHTNRKHHWKRVLNQYYKNEYEGVPS